MSQLATELYVTIIVFHYYNQKHIMTARAYVWQSIVYCLPTFFCQPTANLQDGPAAPRQNGVSK